MFMPDRESVRLRANILYPYRKSPVRERQRERDRETDRETEKQTERDTEREAEMGAGGS